MTEILCNWLNSEVKLSKEVDKSNIARDFSTGYLFGEIFHHFQLQDDFGSFSAGQTSNAKLYNFMQLEPTFHLLEIPFDANIAHNVMTQKYGVATRLLYQMYISLQKKVKNNLTGAAMQTMRASAPVKLEMIESGLYKERLKTLIPRESDLTLDEVSSRFERKRDENEKKAIAQRYKQHMEYEAIKQEQRKLDLEKSRRSKQQQTELLAKIQAAVVHIPKPPPSKTLQAIKQRRDIRNRKEAESTRMHIRSFEENLKKLIAPAAGSQAGKDDEDALGGTGGFDYLDRIKTRLSEERIAREERAKRRRKVLVDQMKAHHAQEEAHRQEQIVQRLMRQSQMERRVAVQLMQVRSEKDNIRKNRIFREKQYEERRLKDFQDALDLEARLATLAKAEYEENAAEEKELHNRNMTRKRQERYKKHYQACGDILSSIIDFSCKIIEYRNLTEKKVPEKLIREWKKLYLEGQPIYEESQDSRDAEIQVRRQEILNSQDFAEYKNMLGEWKPDESAELQKPPPGSILGHILHRMFNMVHPPEEPPSPPKFPDFPIQAAVVGKMFAGKSTILENLAKSHNIAHLSMDGLLSAAIQAFQEGELEPVSRAEINVATVHVEPPTPVTGEARDGSETPIGEENAKDEGHEKPVKERGLSDRAKLGEKALKYLEVGDAVPDSILVDVLTDEIHKLPEGRGWILDGFPNTVQQAVLLEKAITGNDVSPLAAPVKKRLSKTSSLVSDPKPPPQPVAGTTALDVVLIVDVSDEMVLKRALGRTYEQKDEKIFHEEFSPAPLGSRTGIGSTEKVVDVEDKAFDKDQVQHRVSSFHDNSKKLENFYTKLSMIQHVDGEQERELVYKDAEKVLFQTLERVKSKDKEEVPKVDELEEEPKEEPPPPPKAEESSRTSSPVSKGSKAPSPTGSKKSRSPKERSKSAEKGGKSRSRSGSRKGSAKSKKSRSPTPTPAPPPEEVQGPPPPKPGEPDWVYVDQPLPMEVARIAVPMWDNVESNFKNSCMHIFYKIREEREIIIRYIYQSRKDFRAHLRRPDMKQTFVDAWQKDFNEIADDIRDDEETKAEMHQRLYDLKERLWDICDTKKEEAEAERAELMNDGWLEDHLGLLINQYLSLMQSEIDRFQSTTKILKDYYTGMVNKVPVEDSQSTARLPLVELDVDEPLNPASSSETMGSEGAPHESASDTKKSKKGKDDEGEVPVESDGHIKIPLIQRGATFSLASDDAAKGKKGKGPEQGGDTQLGEGELEEKTIVDAYNTAVNYVTNLVQNDIAAKEAEAEEERRLKEEEDKAKMAAAAPADKKGGGKKKSAKGGKGRKSKSPTPVPTTPVDEMSEEDKKKMEIANNMREEYFASLKEEETRVKSNLALIRYRGILTLSELKENMNTSYAEMLEWLGARYLSEMKSIEQLTEAGQHAIESGVKLKYQVCLNQDEFVINMELKVARTPSPPPIPPPVEVTMPEVFTVVQLSLLLRQFQKVSPSGTIANKSFTELLSDSSLLTFGEDALPEAWLTVTYSQLVEICNLLSPESEYVDWRKFLLAIAKPWPMPTMEQLVQARILFQNADVAQNGWITEDQYRSVKTWLCDSIPDEERSELTYPRMKNLHEFFFQLFADWEQSPPRLDYVNMLMYFAMEQDTLQGFVRALSVAVGEVFPRVYKVVPTSSSSSKILEGDDGVFESASNISIKADSNLKPTVSMQAWWIVMHHGSSCLSDSHRFSISEDPDDKFSLERIQSVYEALEAEDLAPQPLQLLLQHPLIQDAVATTKRYQLPDVISVFDRASVPTVDVDDSQSIQASIN